MPVTCQCCGKILCNQQSLDYHLKSQNCKQKREPEGRDSFTSLQNYDRSYICDLRGFILYISENSDFHRNRLYQT